MALIDINRRHYRSMLPAAPKEEHPVDLLFAAIPAVAKIDGKTKRLSEHLNDPRHRDDEEVWQRYQDLVYEQRLVWQEDSFDLGFEYGRIAGLAASIADAHHKAVESVSLALQAVVTESPADGRLVLAAFLTVARALVLANDSVAADDFPQYSQPT